ncbi:hypothetical protein OIU79_016840 [Salix purpurea]|uniref:Uncharacterized protein n=1 Tax=Salix purpurea TaxID=77065 RepID=A0A9Q0PFL9_SALPP|nr:hypothetical protein OIU79_016840 [Salix purpurea]
MSLEEPAASSLFLLLFFDFSFISSKNKLTPRISHAHLTPKQNGIVNPLNIVVYENVDAIAILWLIPTTVTDGHRSPDISSFQVDPIKRAMAALCGHEILISCSQRWSSFRMRRGELIVG